MNWVVLHCKDLLSEGSGTPEEANQKLREVILDIWKHTPVKMLNEVVPNVEGIGYRGIVTHWLQLVICEGSDFSANFALEDKEVTVGKFYAASLIQGFFRSVKKRRERGKKSKGIGTAQDFSLQVCVETII